MEGVGKVRTVERSLGIREVRTWADTVCGYA